MGLPGIPGGARRVGPAILAPGAVATRSALPLISIALLVAGQIREPLLPLVFESELLATAVAILIFVAVRRRHQERALDALAAATGVSRSSLRGVPSEAALALLPVVRSLTDRSDRLVSEAMLDDLTGIHRRRPGMAALVRDIARARRALIPRLSVAMIDVDGLKAVNDVDGHSAGDGLLRRVVDAVTHRLRAQDLMFRYGGDEFVCVFPNTDAGLAWQLLTGIEAALAADLGRPAFSFGVAALQPGDTTETLLERADRGLYASRANRHGRPLSRRDGPTASLPQTEDRGPEPRAPG